MENVFFIYYNSCQSFDFESISSADRSRTAAEEASRYGLSNHSGSQGAVVPFQPQKHGGSPACGQELHGAATSTHHCSRFDQLWQQSRYRAKSLVRSIGSLQLETSEAFLILSKSELNKFLLSRLGYVLFAWVVSPVVATKCIMSRTQPSDAFFLAAFQET